MSAKKAAAQAAQLELTVKAEGPKRRFLSPKEYYLLCEDVKANYAKSGLGDKQFAERATEVLAFEVRESHVAQARQVFDIPSAKMAAAHSNGDLSLVNNRLAALEQRVQYLYDQLGMK